jgi:hypothetical protein
MPNVFDLKKQHHVALTKAESILNAADAAGRELTDVEQQE